MKWHETQNKRKWSHCYSLRYNIFYVHMNSQCIKIKNTNEISTKTIKLYIVTIEFDK